MKKSPISRANIVHFDTIALYQNVSYKMACLRGIEPLNLTSEISGLPLTYRHINITNCRKIDYNILN